MKVAFQGIKGAYSELAVAEVFGEKTATIPVVSFEELFEKVENKEADYAMVPVENSAAGRVTEIHFLLAQSNLKIVAEHYQWVQHCLLGTAKDASQIKLVHSHIQALSQCRKFLLKNHYGAVASADTAAAARKVAELDASNGAIASKMAADEYGLEVLAQNIQDNQDNITRFVILARESNIPPLAEKNVITSILFHTKNQPSALYDALGSFAKLSLNLTRLEGLVTDAKFAQAHFYADIEAHGNAEPMQQALKELKEHTRWIKTLGVYKAHKHRRAD